jgi:hypothetical protein
LCLSVLAGLLDCSRGRLTVCRVCSVRIIPKTQHDDWHEQVPGMRGDIVYASPLLLQPCFPP